MRTILCLLCRRFVDFRTTVPGKQIFSWKIKTYDFPQSFHLMSSKTHPCVNSYKGKLNCVFIKYSKHCKILYFPRKIFCYKIHCTQWFIIKKMNFEDIFLGHSLKKTILISSSKERWIHSAFLTISDSLLCINYSWILENDRLPLTMQMDPVKPGYYFRINQGQKMYLRIVSFNFVVTSHIPILINNTVTNCPYPH